MFNTQRPRRRIPIHRLVLVTAVLATGCGAQRVGSGGSAANGEPAATQPAVVLRMANQYGELAQLPALAYFVDRVEELSGGDMVITVANSYGNFSADVEQRVIRHVAGGDIDLAWVGSRAFDKLGMTAFQALTAPMLVDSYALEQEVIESGITAEMLAGLDALGAVGLAVLADGLRKPIGVNGPIVDAADWDGSGFGTYGSEVQERSIQALGATPALVFGPHREAAIMDGTIRGFEMGMLIYQDPKWVELAPHVTVNVNLWPQMDVLIIGPDRLGSLTDEQRGWLQQAADDAARRSGTLVDSESTAIEVACAAGARFVEASDAELSELRDRFAPVYAELEADPLTRMFIEQIQALKDSTTAEPPPLIPAGCRE